MNYAVNFKFPAFGLQIIHDGDLLHYARFFDPEKEQLELYFGGDSSLSIEINSQLQKYVCDPKFVFDLPYKLAGTDHQLKIWHIMEGIISGNVLTYGEVAKLIRSAPRAVGGACGRNPLAVIVPCHRIIGSNHTLGGFNSGNIFFNLGIKRWLLEHEGIIIK